MSHKFAQRVTLVTALVGASALVGLTPVKAATWNFNSPSGNLGPTEDYTSGSITIHAAGFTNNGFGTGADLYGKAGGGDEDGLGIADFTDHEIGGDYIIRIDFSEARAASQVGFTFQMNSTTGGEKWSVYGSDSATTGYSLVLASLANDEGSHTLGGSADSYDFYYFIYSGPGTAGGNNVMLASISSATSEGGITPIPGALPLFASGLGALGLLGWRRKRKPVSA